MTTPSYGTDAMRASPRCTSSLQAKRDGRPLVMITAYDYPSGRIAERAGVDLVLVGDSAAMVVLGHTSTVPATMDEMLMLTAAVTRACRRALVVADLPFMSYQVSDEDALRAAGRFLKEAAADAVKLEGAGPMLARIRALAGAGIPVVAHLGLTPQTATSQGGLRAQGKTGASRAPPAPRRPRGRGRGRLRARARGSAGAGRRRASAASSRSRRSASARVRAATARCSSSTTCSASARARCRASSSSTQQLGELAVEAVARYADDVRARRFPQERHTYAIAADELERFQRLVEAGSPVGAEDEDGVL